MTGSAFVTRALTRGKRFPAPFVLVASAAVLAGCRGDVTPKPATETIPVLVRQVNVLNRSDLVVVSGDVAASESGNVGFQVPGRVTRVWPDEGQVVQAGEPLAQLDTTEYHLQLTMATAAAREAEDQYNRLQQMYDQKGIPPADFIKIQTANQQAQAQLALVRQHLADTRLVAPLSGAIARRGIQVGEQAAPGMPVFTIVATDPIKVRVGVPEAEIGRIRVGQVAEIRIPALPNEKFEGRVKVIGVAADPVSRTYSLEISVPNPRQLLRPGMIAEARIRQDNRISAVTVPADAVVHDPDGAAQVYVYRPAEQRVHATRVTVGGVYGTEVEVTSGLSDSDVVVVGGQFKVHEGSKVEVTNAANAANASNAAAPAANAAATGGRKAP